jgi:hypothetical protein
MIYSEHSRKVCMAAMLSVEDEWDSESGKKKFFIEEDPYG